MKTGNRLSIVAVVIVGLALGCIGVPASAESTASDLQERWFMLGYSFDVSDTSDEILVFRLLLQDVSTPEVISLVRQWADDEVTKEQVRATLLDALRTQGDLASLEAFLLGEWVSNVEDAVIDLQEGAQADSERKIFVAIERANELAYLAEHFLDVFAGDVPTDVEQALEQIAARAQTIDVAGLIGGTADVRGTLDAIFDLYDDCAVIKDSYIGD